MTPPLVSVVIPVYNCQAYVAEAVESALAQNGPSLEIIVVDDGSDDGSAEVLRGFGDRIRLVCVPNGGPAQARNLGLAQARGRYVAFLDADDVWLSGKIAAQVACLETHQDVGICYTGWHVWEAGADAAFQRPAFAELPVGEPSIDPVRSGWIFQRLLFDCELLTTTVMMRTEVARRVGCFEPSLAVGEDYDFWLRMSCVAKIVRLDCTAALYRMLPGSASHRPRPLNFEYEVVRRNIDRFGLSHREGDVVSTKRLERRLDDLVLSHGYVHLLHGSDQVALRSFLQLLRRRPWRLKLWVLAARAAWLGSTTARAASVC